MGHLCLRGREREGAYHAMHWLMLLMGKFWKPPCFLALPQLEGASAMHLNQNLNLDKKAADVE